MKKNAFVFEIVSAIIIILFIAGLFLPSSHPTRDKEHESESKKNMHSIQLAIEQYAVDHNGEYPRYLIGGDNRTGTITKKDGTLSVRTATGVSDGKSDPLIREGYLDGYPRNPFCRNGAAILGFQVDVDDPLRPDAKGNSLGNRFGADGRIMGNVMPDHRYPAFIWTDKSGMAHKGETAADFTGYPFYDVWHSNRPNLYLPGEFFYKSNGPIVGGNAWNQPAETDQFILGVYGSIRSKGKDVLGPVPAVPAYGADGKPISDYAYADALLAWIKGKDESGAENPGCPFGAPGMPLSKGNPNGIDDGIILVLASGD